MIRTLLIFIFFFFNDTATTEIYTLSLHDALPISLFSLDFPHSLGLCSGYLPCSCFISLAACLRYLSNFACLHVSNRSEEHTSELQSQSNLVCRLLLEKKKNHIIQFNL